MALFGHCAEMIAIRVTERKAYGLDDYKGGEVEEQVKRMMEENKTD